MGEAQEVVARMSDQNAMPREEMESLDRAATEALAVVALAHRRGIVLVAEVYEAEPGWWQYALRRALLEDSGAGASDQKLGGVAGACSGFVMRIEPDEDGARDSRDGGERPATMPVPDVPPTRERPDAGNRRDLRGRVVPVTTTADSHTRHWQIREDWQIMQRQQARVPSDVIAAQLDTTRRHVIEALQADVRRWRRAAWANVACSVIVILIVAMV